MKDKLMPVRFLLEKIPVQCQGIIDANPFLAADEEISGEHFPGRAEAPDAGDHGRDQDTTLFLRTSILQLS